MEGIPKRSFADACRFYGLHLWRASKSVFRFGGVVEAKVALLVWPLSIVGLTFSPNIAAAVRPYGWYVLGALYVAFLLSSIYDHFAKEREKRFKLEVRPSKELDQLNRILDKGNELLSGWVHPQDRHAGTKLLDWEDADQWWSESYPVMALVFGKSSFDVALRRIGMSPSWRCADATTYPGEEVNNFLAFLSNQIAAYEKRD